MSNIPNNITFDDGFIEISINNDPNRIIRWNPTDTSFVDRFYKFMSFIETIQGRLNEVVSLTEKLNLNNNDSDENINNISDAGAVIDNIGKDVAKELDNAFGAKVSDVAFMGANPVSPSAKNGQFLFINLITALEPIITESFKKAEIARQKYTAPYKNKGKQK